MKVYFNNSCNICRAEINLYKKQNIKDIEWVDITDNKSAEIETQKNILNELFDQLGKVNNPKTAELLEKKIWSIWNKHPTNNKLTEKLEFGMELMQYGDYNYALKVFENILAEIGRAHV